MILKTLLIWLVSFLILCSCDDVQLLQDYLQIDTSHPTPDYESAVTWLEIQANAFELDFQRIDLTPEENLSFPMALITWTGTDPTLDSVLLYNHMDVVPVDTDSWTVNPFGGEIIEDKIYGRGVQDMKSVGIEQLIAIRNLIERGCRPSRTIHVGFFPDEEQAMTGLRSFMKTPIFETLKIGFALDEGMHNENGVLEVYYTQRSCLWVKFTMPGTSGHGSMLMNNTAGEKLQKLLNRMLNLRNHEALRLKLQKSITLGDVTSINLNIIEGGIQENVVPPQLSVTFDIRLTPSWDLAVFMQFLDETCAEAGPDVTYEILGDFTAEGQGQPDSTDVNSKTWWNLAISKAAEKRNLKIVHKVFPASTDGQFLRKIGIPVLGMNTIFKSPGLMHSNDEFLYMDDFTEGIEIYTEVIRNLALPTTKKSTSHHRIGGTKSQKSTSRAAGRRPMIIELVFLLVTLVTAVLQWI